MAELDCAELSLPSEFLAEDMLLEKTKSEKTDGGGRGEGDGASCFPSEFPYDWAYVWDVNSPGEPVAGMEKSNEERIGGLSRQMAHYFHQEDEKVGSFSVSGDDRRATLVALSAAAYSSAFNREASHVLSLLPSPPSTPLGKHKCDAGYQFYAAANKQQKQDGGGLLCRPEGKPFSPFAAGLTKNTTTGYYARPSLIQHKDAVAHIHQLKRQQLAELQVAAAWRRHNRAKSGGGLAVGGPARPPGSPRIPSWTPPPQQAGSGMRAVFLGPGSRRETCGTGVFLPRRVGTPTEPRKKPALSTVLLPARVMQALNLNLDELGPAQPRSSGGFVLQHGEDAMLARSSAVMSQTGSFRPQPLHAGHHHHDVCLPSEWTY
ncbi:hypothetical protein Taro_015559 [Colocasia esculenta]|uniref:Uncharacterized protein n=1 Tax=Colocasia esculenta TaxID=4460 RepID=A0A843UHV6_COLES|nr:hypothetical protein [Colocasia esculenta]